jgi:TfoX/Sxy family transcriptional regulator of competence genes
MAYDEGLAERIRERLADGPRVTERRMFGGLAFLARLHMCVGIVGEDLMVRVGPEAYERALAEPHVRRMDFTGRPMKGLVFVAPAGYESEGDLDRWVGRALAYVSTLPARGERAPRPRRAAAARPTRRKA